MAIAATNLWHEAQLTFEGNPSIYSLKGGSETVLNEAEKIRKCEVGTEITGHLEEKVIMFVGEIGSGKTTMINTIANYILGIEWKHDKRYKLSVDREEREKESQTKSKTKWITSFTFHQPKTLSYKVTLVDTPGFGDTADKERDKVLARRIKTFFNTKGGIDHINVVAFVVKASSVCLTQGQKYIFDSVLHLFGGDIRDNIYLFITHAESTQMDNEDAPVIQAVKADNIPVKGICVCNNDVLFYQKDKNETKLAASTNMHYEAMWDTGRENLTKFFTELDTCTPKSLTLSSIVLSERTKLETTVSALPGLIKSSLVKLNILQEEEKVLERYREEMQENRNFSYTVYDEIIIGTTLNDGKEATVCNVCRRTCHFPCKKDIFRDIMGLRMCAAMRFFPELRGCGVCLKNCSVDSHTVGPMKYDRKVVEVTKTKMDMKKRYDIAKENVNNAEAYVKVCKMKREEAQQELDQCVKKLRKCVERLDKISLRSDPYAIVKHLTLLKENETHSMEPGWEDRVKKLDDILQDEIQNMASQRGGVRENLVSTMEVGVNSVSHAIGLTTLGQLFFKNEEEKKQRTKSSN